MNDETNKSAAALARHATPQGEATKDDIAPTGDPVEAWCHHYREKSATPQGASETAGGVQDAELCKVSTVEEAYASWRRCFRESSSSLSPTFGEVFKAGYDAATAAPEQAGSRGWVGGEAIEAASAAFYDTMIGSEREFWPHHEGWAGKTDALKARVRDRMRTALEAAQAAARTHSDAEGRS